jgi:hypothetical protein
LEETNRPRASQELPVFLRDVRGLAPGDRKAMQENYSNFWGNRNKFFDLRGFGFSIPVENENILWKKLPFNQR